MNLPRVLMVSLAAAGSAVAAAATAELLVGDPTQCPVPPATTVAPVTATTNPGAPTAEWLSRAAPWLNPAPTPRPNTCGPCGMG